MTLGGADSHTHEPDDIVAGLTPAQARAVLHDRGPLLVLAGPGSGKTRVITRRIAHLVATGVPAWQILAVTFTNKAAGEMRNRVGAILGENPAERGLTVTTFHSLCVRMLRRWAELATSELRDRAGQGPPVRGERGDASTSGPGGGGAGEFWLVRPGFVIYDADDQAALMKKTIAELQLSTSNWPPRTVLGVISNAKNQLVDARAFRDSATDFYTRNVARVYEAYQRKLHAANAVDFDDLLLLTVRVLRESTMVREQVRRKYRHLLVDEYQDTNKAQFEIARLIAGEETPGQARPPNICVVGDPDQSIYGWRGADIANILQFEEHYPSAEVIALGENFRSLEPILGAADRLIRNNQQRKHKPLIAVRGSGGASSASKRGPSAPTVEVVACRDEHHEAALVVDWLRARRDEARSAATRARSEQGGGEEGGGEPALDWRDCAVFYRNNALSRVIEEVLRREAVPYVLVRGTAFYDREEVRHALAYLRVVANPADSVSLARIVNTPARGIGQTSLDKIEADADARGLSLISALRDAARAGAGTTARATSAIAKFVATIDAWREGAGVRDGVGGLEPESFMGQSLSAAAADGSLAQLVERVIRESGLEKMYAGEEERLENLAELVSSARDFEGAYEPEPPEDAPDSQGEPATLGELLAAYLERVALVADTDAIDPTRGAVTLMTLHAAKGLEFKAVAMIGLEEGLLPHSRGSETEAALEEERRLCFVGVTRAMDRLLMTSARYRTVRGVSERTIPSRFLDELAGPGVVMSDQSDAHSYADEGSYGYRDEDDNMRDFLAGGSARSSAAHGAVVKSGPGGSGGAGGFSAGQRVRHPQFGVGTIESVTPGGDPRVRVKFAGVGTKTLVLAYARLERVG